MRQPVIFVGHGSPMNGIENNEFSRGWREIARHISKPKAILCISAHWFVGASLITGDEQPPTIHDFWGFPKELYNTKYPALGSPILAGTAAQLVRSAPVVADNSWGFDHGCWVPLIQMYPGADIPLCQLSLNFNLPAEAHYKIGEEIKPLRDDGVLIIASGNIVHNLGRIDWAHPDSGFNWAEEFNSLTIKLIKDREDKRLIDYENLGDPAYLSIPTPDHYWPLLYTLGASDHSERVSFFNDSCVYGSVSMTSVVIGSETAG